VTDTGNTTLSGVVRITTGYAFACALRTDGRVWCWGYNGNGELGDGTGLDPLPRRGGAQPL
jgi:alpha-tubulin suppressor-like RCC1 family protein